MKSIAYTSTWALAEMRHCPKVELFLWAWSKKRVFAERLGSQSRRRLHLHFGEVGLWIVLLRITLEYNVIRCNDNGLPTPMKLPSKVKTELVQVRVASDVKAEWEAAAERERRSLSDWLRLAAEDRALKSVPASETSP